MRAIDILQDVAIVLLMVTCFFQNQSIRYLNQATRANTDSIVAVVKRALDIQERVWRILGPFTERLGPRGN